MLAPTGHRADAWRLPCSPHRTIGAAPATCTVSLNACDPRLPLATTNQTGARRQDRHDRRIVARSSFSPRPIQRGSFDAWDRQVALKRRLRYALGTAVSPPSVPVARLCPPAIWTKLASACQASGSWFRVARPCLLLQPGRRRPTIVRLAARAAIASTSAKTVSGGSTSCRKSAHALSSPLTIVLRLAAAHTAAAAEPETITNTLGMKLVLIPAGEFHDGGRRGPERNAQILCSLLRSQVARRRVASAPGADHQAVLRWAVRSRRSASF